MPPVDLPVSTLTGLEGARADRVATWARRAFLLLLVGVVVAGLLGVLGVRSRTASASQAGWTVDLRYAAVARAGLDVPWQVTVRHRGGFGGQPVTLAVTGEYFAIYETQGFFPEPSAQARDGDTLYLEFDAPPGDVLVVSYDAYVQPASQVGRSGTVGVYDGTRVLAPVAFRTRLVP